MNPRLVEIIDALLDAVQRFPQDLDWQPYCEDEQQLVGDLRDHAERVGRGDGSRLPELKFELLPTGDLNEIAISSGWAELYLVLANEFDELTSGMTPRPPEPASR